MREGQPASSRVDAYPGRSFAGRVVQVRNAPVSIQNVVTYDVIVEVDNSDLELKPGMTATVAITTAHRDDALRVPLRALRFRPEERGPRTTRRPTPPAAAFAARAPAARCAAVALRTRDPRRPLSPRCWTASSPPGDPVVVAYARGERGRGALDRPLAGPPRAPR